MNEVRIPQYALEILFVFVNFTFFKHCSNEKEKKTEIKK